MSRVTRSRLQFKRWLGAVIDPAGPEQFGKFLKEEIDKWAGVIGPLSGFRRNGDVLDAANHCAQSEGAGSY